MPPTEETILQSFLLQKAGLRDVLTLAEFSVYFPLSKRSSSLVRQLYRDLQSQRNTICNSVLKQIKLECRLGENLVAKQRAGRGKPKSADPVDMESDVEIQVRSPLKICLAGQLFGQGNAEVAIPITMIMPSMKNAVEKLRERMDEIQQEVDAALINLQRSAFQPHDGE
jgi:hypothetical protein